MNAFFKLFKYVFLFLLVTFLVGGLLIVLAQTAGLFMLDGGLITTVKKSLAPWVFAAATLCAMSAFVLSYSPEARASRKRQIEKERRENEEHRTHVEEDVRREFHDFQERRLKRRRSNND
ncbi:hypothetical protein CGLAUT_12035 [Corynebacterium glaucum]|uniref:hypothetical protein n=1 Tax=Corynebacterium glaucum TaxID=187491 RepID=UPI0025B4D49A|nr:hypothetical protein [Corynebacterium glaucum]WJZ08859.1 hypothetical protein CGLAUT_12035 [Corynebacterium glaucum]